ncbi:MAG: hypothetical protein HHJ09_14565 [Glaciimonas sp.]|nr:hypothetical protein [Glaciimonas sp.]
MAVYVNNRRLMLNYYFREFEGVIGGSVRPKTDGQTFNAERLLQTENGHAVL